MKPMTTKELANKLNVSSASILEHFAKLKKNINHHSYKKNNKRYYDNVAISIIISSFKNNNYGKFSKNNNYEIMKNTINRQAESIKQLHKLLDQQQLLALNSQKELSKIQNKLSYSKHGFFWRLFH